MDDLLVQMIRYQELKYAQAEHKAAASKVSVKAISESMEAILDSLPKEWAKVITRLQNGGEPALAPVANGICLYCRIQVPTQMYQEVLKAEQIHQCPCCARILFKPEGGELQSVSRGSTRGRGGIARFSSPGLMVPKLKAAERDDTLKALVQALADEGWADDPETILKAAVEREELVSTAVEHGLAFPHVRGVEGGGLVITLGISKKGVQFGSPNGRLSRIVFFSVIPQAASGFYLRLMAGLVRVFRDDTARKTLIKCNNPEDAWSTLLELTQDVIP